MTRPRKPNILLIVTDQERARNTLPKGLDLPAHDRLRERGVEFTEYHVNAVACSPSRSTIYTGQHIQRTRVFDNAGRRSCLDPQLTPTIGHMLRGEGYYTAYAGKWHLSGDGPLPGPDGDLSGALVPFGFDFYHPLSIEGDSYGGAQEGTTLDAALARWVRRWFTNHAADIDRPWFLAVNLINPHDIMFFDATGRQNETRLLDWAVMAPAPEHRPYGDDLRHELPLSFTADLGSRPAVHRAFAVDSALAFGELPHTDEAAWRRFQNYYFNCLRDVDSRIGEIVDALDTFGAGDTIVVLTSDHGELAGAHGLRGKGPVVYRENFAVPLIVVHPDVKTKSASNALFAAVDLAPTLLSLAGVGQGEMKAKFPALAGHDMSASLSDPGSEGARAAILLNASVVHASNPASTRERAEATRGERRPKYDWPIDYIDSGLKSFMRGCYDGRYRFARYFAPKDHHSPRDWATLIGRNEIELYDTARDFGECKNLAQDLDGNRALILRLNDKLNALIEAETGGDNGDYLPPPASQWHSS